MDYMGEETIKMSDRGYMLLYGCLVQSSCVQAWAVA